MCGLLKKLLGCWILGCSILLYAGSYGQTQTPPTPQQENPAKPKKKAEEDIRGTEKSPLSVKLLNTGKSKDETDREAQNEEGRAHREDLLNKLTLSLATATVLLALATVFLAAYTKKLWRSTRRLVDGTITTEAAYLLPQLTGHSGFFEDLILTPGGRPQFHYGFRNHGKTLAVIRRWRDFTSRTLPSQPIFEEPWDARPVQYIPIVGEELGSEVWTQIPDGMTANDVMDGLNHGRWLYIVGEVEYEDIFGVGRIQGYCLRIMRIEPGIVRFWRDGGLAYNQRYQVGQRGPN